MRDDFCCFILTHGRAQKVHTVKTLLSNGYTGKYYIVIDSADQQKDEYIKLYGEKVIVFDKKVISFDFDIGDNFDGYRGVVYARNVCWDIAANLGIKYFLQLDDDYRRFEHRVARDNKLLLICNRDLDKLFTATIEFLERIDVATVAYAQTGDFIGGIHGNTYKRGLLRKAMNTFFCKTDKRFSFVGRINEDTNTYTLLSTKGEVFLTVVDASITQETTQQQDGGLTDLYLDAGTYVKSFYTVMMSPSCAKVVAMGTHYKRLHHRIAWNNCAPKILHEQYKKV